MSNEIISFGETTNIHKSGDDVKNVENNEEMPQFYSLSASASSVMSKNNTKSSSLSRRQTYSIDSSVNSSDASFVEQSFDTDGGDFMAYGDCTNQLNEFSELFTNFFDVAEKSPKSARRKKNIRQPDKTKQESREVDEREKDAQIKKESRDEVDDEIKLSKHEEEELRDHLVKMYGDMNVAPDIFNSDEGQSECNRQFSSNGSKSAIISTRQQSEMTLKTGSTKKPMKMTSIKSLKNSKSRKMWRSHNKNLM